MDLVLSMLPHRHFIGAHKLKSGINKFFQLGHKPPSKEQKIEMWCSGIFKMRLVAVMIFYQERLVDALYYHSLYPLCGFRPVRQTSVISAWHTRKRQKYSIQFTKAALKNSLLFFV